MNLALGSGDLFLQSKDFYTQPILNYNYLKEDFDKKRMLEAIHLCIELANDRAFTNIFANRLQPTDSDLSTDANREKWMLMNATTGQHTSCTCKMGPEFDNMAVVNQEGKVHGLDRLRVVDASIMPDCVRANINATVMMIAERIADWILYTP
ncbi:hypothetical protein HYR99_28445 [Candidatus Poribacteria bacterium]|nr:hypothetical protein [Candidatus Poribacteria bacterium]